MIQATNAFIAKVQQESRRFAARFLLNNTVLDCSFRSLVVTKAVRQRMMDLRLVHVIHLMLKLSYTDWQILLTMKNCSSRSVSCLMTIRLTTSRSVIIR